MNRFLTSVAAGLITVLPVAAFAQAPASVTTQAPAKTDAPAVTAKSDAKAPAAAKTTQTHSMNTAKTHPAAAKAATAPVKG